MKIYTTIQGDTWDMIAKKVYNDEKKMDVLMQHNFPLLEYVVFPAGISVRVPESVQTEKDSLPVWRK